LCYADIKSAQVTIQGKQYFVAIFRDNSSRREVEQALREYQQLLRELAAQGAASREAELKHIAREVHDELGQILTALRMDVSLLRIQFGVHDLKLMPKILDMLTLLDQAIQCARDVTVNLRPPALDMGLVAAINWLAGEFTRRTAIPCMVQINEESAVLDDTCILTLFRIVQESLTNITRYAQASAVEIKLGIRDQFITVVIEDDGIGFNHGVMPAIKTYGLMGMKERALAAGGRVEVSSVQGQGTTILVEIPLMQVNLGRRVND
jgi:signal transduction histidine kinase